MIDQVQLLTAVPSAEKERPENPFGWDKICLSNMIFPAFLPKEKIHYFLSRFLAAGSPSR